MWWEVVVGRLDRRGLGELWWEVVVGITSVEVVVGRLDRRGLGEWERPWGPTGTDRLGQWTGAGHEPAQRFRGPGNASMRNEPIRP